MGKGKGFRARLRDSVLEKRGLEPAGKGHLQEAQPNKTKTLRVNLAGGRVFRLKVAITQEKPNKTLMMRLVEEAVGMPLEDILWADTEANVAAALGIHFTTVAKWRKRLKANGTNG